MIAIGFTGTQRGMTLEQKAILRSVLADLIQEYNSVSFHHGDCLGADFEAAEIADKLFHLYTICHPPSVPNKRCYYPSNETRIALPYLERNKQIVQATKILLAAPQGKEILRSGTWSTVRYAKKLGRRIIFIVDGRKLPCQN